MAQGSEVCVFWDFSRNDWNSEGCTITEAVGPNGIVTCQCNHLTNFAVLVVSVTLIIYHTVVNIVCIKFVFQQYTYNKKTYELFYFVIINFIVASGYLLEAR